MDILTINLKNRTMSVQKTKVKADPDAWLRILDGMIESGEHLTTEVTLTDIRDQVEETQSITGKQMKRIQEIRRSVYL